MQGIKRSISSFKSKLRTNGHKGQVAHNPLPPEIWIFVFTVETLSQIDVSNSRLTCRLFAELAKPRAFSTFVFWPFELRLQCHNAALSGERLKQETDRLDYWLSDGIAPHVRNCVISPETSRNTLIPLYTYIGDSPVVTLLHFFFQRISLFFNLERLVCEHIDITERVLKHICEIPKLDSLTVKTCKVSGSRLPSKLRISEFQIQCPYFSHFRGPNHGRGEVGWLDIIASDKLKELTIDIEAPLVVSLLGLASAQTPHVTAQNDFSEKECVNKHIALLIAHAASLTHLTIMPYVMHSSTRGPIPEAPIHLPSLRVYDGSLEILRSLRLTKGTLETLHLRPIYKRAYEDLEMVIRDLQLLDHAPCLIESLEVCVNSVDERLFTFIALEYPKLKNLGIQINRIDEEHVVSLVSKHLPHNVETFTIDTFYISDNFNKLWWVKKGLALRRHMFSTYPKLKRVKFSFRGSLGGFDWFGSGEDKSNFSRKVNSVAYLVGLRHEDP